MVRSSKRWFNQTLAGMLNSHTTPEWNTLNLDQIVTLWWNNLLKEKLWIYHFLEFKSEITMKKLILWKWLFSMRIILSHQCNPTSQQSHKHISKIITWLIMNYWIHFSPTIKFSQSISFSFWHDQRDQQNITLSTLWFFPLLN